MTGTEPWRNLRLFAFYIMKGEIHEPHEIRVPIP